MTDKIEAKKQFNEAKAEYDKALEEAQSALDKALSKAYVSSFGEKVSFPADEAQTRQTIPVFQSKWQPTDTFILTSSAPLDRNRHL